MNFFTHIFHGFSLDFKLLFIVLFLEIISWNGIHVSMGVVCLSDDGGFIFKWGEAHGGHWFWGEGRGFEKNRKMEGAPPPHAPPLWETLVPNILRTV